MPVSWIQVDDPGGGHEKDYQAECNCGWLGPCRGTDTEAACDAALHMTIHEGEDDAKS